MLPVATQQIRGMASGKYLFPRGACLWASNDVLGYLFTYVWSMPPLTRHFLPQSCLTLVMVTLPLLGVQAMGKQWSMLASSCMSQQSGMCTGVKAWPL
jgi:hypothetical protein